MPKKPVDPIGSWFVAAEELGEYIGIRFGNIAPGKVEPEWTYLRHTDYDGIGGLAEILRGKGAILDRLPQIRYPASPSVLAILRTFPRYLGPRRRVSWRQLDSRSKVGDGARPSSAVAWHVFDEASTVKIRHACRKSGVTVNTFLLKHLTKAVRPFLEHESSMVPWMIPVNLRGKVQRERDTANHTSYVAIKVQSYESMRDIHRNIYAALSRGEHWANWYAYQTGRFMTAKLQKRLIVTERAMLQWNLGGFSNLGEWDPEKQIKAPQCAGDWLFCPPVLRCQLVGAGCVTFQNRLSLMVQAHEDLTSDPAVPKAWVQNWIKEIEIDLDGA